MAQVKDTLINVWKESMTPKDLQALRRKLAKRANQRLVRLERATSKVTGETYAGIGASEIAYNYLENNYKQVKGGVKRFSERLDAVTDYTQLRREVSALQNFLESKSSLVSGLREIESSRIRTFESGDWGSAKYTGKSRRKLLFASTKEFYDFIHSDTFRELKGNGFTSEQIVESYDTARETYKGSDKEALEALQEALETFREKGKGTLKELKAAAGGKPLK